MPFDRVDPKVDFPAPERRVLRLWDRTDAFNKLRARNQQLTVAPGGPRNRVGAPSQGRQGCRTVVKKLVDSVMTIGEVSAGGKLSAPAELKASWKSAIEEAIRPVERSAR